VPLQSREGKQLSHWDTTCGYFGHQAQKLYHIKNYACSFAPIYFYFCWIFDICPQWMLTFVCPILHLQFTKKLWQLLVGIVSEYIFQMCNTRVLFAAAVIVKLLWCTLYCVSVTITICSKNVTDFHLFFRQRRKRRSVFRCSHNIPHLVFLSRSFSLPLSLSLSLSRSRVSAVASYCISSETSHSIVSVIQFDLIQFLLLVSCPLKNICPAGLIRLNDTRVLDSW
jgi:hypothetical protein